MIPEQITERESDCNHFARLSRWVGEYGALAIPLLTALVHLAAAYSFHGIIQGKAVAIVIIALAASMTLCFMPFRQVRVKQFVNVAFRITGLWVCAWILLLGGADVHAWATAASYPLLFTTLVMVVAVTSLAASEQHWRRFRLPILVGIVLFVASGQLITKFWSQSVGWPAQNTSPIPLHASHEASDGVIFLLLDELGARDGEKLVSALNHTGLKVQSKGISPVSNDATIKVIAHLWTGHAFPEPSICSSSAVCSSSKVLDFAKVFATRPDIDLVGFWLPYCAMQGLRYCKRVGIAIHSVVFDLQRWNCGTLTLFTGREPPECQFARHKAWLDMRDDAWQAILGAPFWHEGGMLYAHLPMPHLPSRLVEGSLREKYEDNLNVSAAVVKELALRLASSGLKRGRLVIFSDHSLRVARACSSPEYRTPRCEQENGPQDAEVPLIVASFGGHPADINGITSNAQVFSLAEF